MDSNGWKSAQSGVEPTMDTGSTGTDWRNQWRPDSRQRIVNKIVDTLKRHLPFSGQEGLQELKLIASRFEEKIYSAATSQSDYLRKIALKMLTMETKSQNTMATTVPVNFASNNKNLPDAVTSMDSNGWKSAQSGVEPTMDTGSSGTDWRNQCCLDSRQRIVNKIMDYLKRHLPFSGQEGLQELKLIASRFEEKIYTTATSQSDYLRKISLKMLTMEIKSQNTMATIVPVNSARNSKNPLDAALLDSTTQTGNANNGDWQEDVYQKGRGDMSLSLCLTLDSSFHTKGGQFSN